MFIEEDDISFLNADRVKDSKDKQESGELTCNIDSPEDCESCSGWKSLTAIGAKNETWTKYALAWASMP